MRLYAISPHVGEGAYAVVIIDGAGYHSMGSLSIPENITLIRLPLYFPELNSVENIWACLRQNKLANSEFDTYGDILSACCEAWSVFVKDPETATPITSRNWAKVNP